MWRSTASIAILVGLLPFFVCTVGHICMAGHLQHPPLALGLLIDIVWSVAFATAAIASVASNMRGRRAIAPLIWLIIMTRLDLGSVGGAFWIIEVPIGLYLAYVAIQGLRGAAVNIRPTRAGTLYVGAATLVILILAGLGVRRDVEAAHAGPLTPNEATPTDELD